MPLEQLQLTSVSKKLSQHYELAIFQPCLAIFPPTTLMTFTKLRFWWTIWSAKGVQNLIESKATTQKTTFFCFHFFQFWKKKKENLPLLNDNFMTISGHFNANYTNIFHTIEVQTVILKCLVYLYLNWIKSYNIILVKNIFFHAWKCIISGLFHETHNQVKCW